MNKVKRKTFPPFAVFCGVERVENVRLGAGKSLSSQKVLLHQLLLPTGLIPRSAFRASDTLYLCIYCPTGARVACKGNVIGVCEACACPCLVSGHVCGPAVNKASVSAVHTYPIRRSLAILSLRSF